MNTALCGPTEGVGQPLSEVRSFECLYICMYLYLHMYVEKFEFFINFKLFTFVNEPWMGRNIFKTFLQNAKINIQKRVFVGSEER